MRAIRNLSSLELTKKNCVPLAWMEPLSKIVNTRLLWTPSYCYAPCIVLMLYNFNFHIYYHIFLLAYKEYYAYYVSMIIINN